MSELARAAFLRIGDEPARADGHRFESFARGFRAAEFEASVGAAGYAIVVRSASTYPPLLRAIHDPPAALFLRGSGSLDVLARRSVAVVGARGCSGYGAAVARSLARELAAAGVVVVSGLARGIDGHAHRGALDAGGVTIAVLGCGIDRTYPSAHRALAEEIARDGLVVSEYPPGVAPAPWRFPARNRIIAGLAGATLVVEARVRSGALITADFALEDGRDVLAVPGEITSALSAGTNGLIRAGATPVTCVADALEAVGIEPAPRPDPRLGPEAERVLDALTTPAGADEIARTTGLAADVVAATLAQLELESLVTCEGGLYRGVVARIA